MSWRIEDVRYRLLTQIFFLSGLGWHLPGLSEFPPEHRLLLLHAEPFQLFFAIYNFVYTCVFNSFFFSRFFRFFSYSSFFYYLLQSWFVRARF